MEVLLPDSPRLRITDGQASGRGGAGGGGGGGGGTGALGPVINVKDNIKTIQLLKPVRAISPVLRFCLPAHEHTKEISFVFPFPVWRRRKLL